MRPPDLDVTLRLFELDCAVTQDSGNDEPYLWVLGFKVDAETVRDAGGLVPAFGVQVFEGVPAFPFIKGAGSMKTSEQAPVPSALGTRSMRLKPAYLKSGDWFPGLVGLVCLLWEQDAFSVATSEAGHRKFNEVFGPALATQLNGLLMGDFDTELSMDEHDQPTGNPEQSQTFAWRLSRLRNPAGRRHAVQAITRRVRATILDSVKGAIKAEGSLLELVFDQDDLLGVEAAVYLGDELRAPTPFTMRFTDEGADYTAKGQAASTPVTHVSLESLVTKLERRPDRAQGAWLSVCRGAPQLYWATAWLQTMTTRYDLVTRLGPQPSSVQWLLNDTLLAMGAGSLTVTFTPVEAVSGPPASVLAPFFRGGPVTLDYVATATSLELTNRGGQGVFLGRVRAAFAYAGDPPLTDPGAKQPDDVLRRGAVQEADLAIMGVRLEMDDTYRADVSKCLKTIATVDLRQVELDFERGLEQVGHPPPLARDLHKQARAAVLAERLVVFTLDAPTDVNRRIVRRTGEEKE